MATITTIMIVAAIGYSAFAESVGSGVTVDVGVGVGVGVNVGVDEGEGEGLGVGDGVAVGGGVEVGGGVGVGLEEGVGVGEGDGEGSVVWLTTTTFICVSLVVTCMPALNKASLALGSQIPSASPFTPVLFVLSGLSVCVSEYPIASAA